MYTWLAATGGRDPLSSPLMEVVPMAIATRVGSPQFPVAASDIPPSSQEAMDAAIADLQAKKDAWVRVSVPERIALLDRLIRAFDAIAPRWVAAAPRGN